MQIIRIFFFCKKKWGRRFKNVKVIFAVKKTDKTTEINVNKRVHDG